MLHSRVVSFRFSIRNLPDHPTQQIAICDQLSELCVCQCEQANQQQWLAQFRVWTMPNVRDHCSSRRRSVLIVGLSLYSAWCRMSMQQVHEVRRLLLMHVSGCQIECGNPVWCNRFQPGISPLFDPTTSPMLEGLLSVGTRLHYLR